MSPLDLSKDYLIIGNKKFTSRLMLGTGKYKSCDEAKQSILNSGCEVLTVSVRKARIEVEVGAFSSSISTLLNQLDLKKIWLMPNTAGCTNAEDAVRLAFWGSEFSQLLGYESNRFIKLEVIPDPRHLFPDSVGTLHAAELLVRKGFEVLPYISADVVLAKQLEEVGSVTVMPLGAAIGSGKGLQNIYNIKIIIENSKIPVVVDAGIGSPSQAAQSMEIGASAVLANTAIAKANLSEAMATGMKFGVLAGRISYLAGQMYTVNLAQPSSPMVGLSRPSKHNLAEDISK
jgi:thiazole synthase